MLSFESMLSIGLLVAIVVIITASISLHRDHRRAEIEEREMRRRNYSREVSSIILNYDTSESSRTTNRQTKKKRYA